MEIKITQRELHLFNMAVMVITNVKPLLLLDENLAIHPEFIEFGNIIAKAINNEPRPYRGNKRVVLEIPEVIQTDNLNKCLRYGIAHASARDRQFKNPKVNLLDSVYGMAIANKLSPNPTNTFRVLTDD